MPRPILKGTRGPSSSGPRLTARFISPPESEDEADLSSSVSTNSQTNSHVVELPSSNSQNAKSDRKASPLYSKKKGSFVAASRKKRHVIVRRQSSQTSQSSSEAGQSIAPSPDQPKSRKERRTLQTSGSKRNLPRKPSAPCQVNTASLDASIERDVWSGGPTPSTQLRRIEILQNEVACSEDLTAEEHEDVEVQRTLLAEANPRVKKESQIANTMVVTSEGLRVLHRSLRPQSDVKVQQKGSHDVQLLDYETKGTASLVPTLTAATGTVNLGDIGAAPTGTSSSCFTSLKGKSKGRNSEDTSVIDMFAKRPIQPVQATAVPDSTGSLAQNKSQLTLLFERERAQSGKYKSDDEKGSRRKR